MNKYFEGIIRQESSKKIFCDIAELKEPILLDFKNCNRCLSGDKVLIKVKDNKIGYIQKLIERPDRILTGQIEINNGFAFIKPWTGDFFKDFFVDKKDNIKNVKNGDMVEFKILDWKKDSKSPKAKVIKKIFVSEEQYMIHRLNLPTKFNDNVIKELDSIELNIEKELSNRIDLRNDTIFSIDPSTCTDIDDALSIERTNFGYRVGIHIADVSHFIKAGSELDKEAYKRSFTYYFPNFNIPMIPQKLSSDLCSLIENQDRLCVSTIINIDKNLNIIDSNVIRTVINNKKKFSYEEAETHKNNPDSPYFMALNNLYTIGASLRNKWFPNELVLNRLETEFVVENNIPTKIKVKNRVSTMDLIQSWMLIANKLVTRKFELLNNKNPWVYRVHNEIDEDNLKILKHEITQIGECWDETVSNTENIKYMLNSENRNIFSEIFIKKFKPAKYSPMKTGHYSLGSDDYTHFTSPIRRYSDIIIHRILLNSIIDKPVYCANIWKDCEWISEQEKKTQRVERYYNNMLGIKFMKDIKTSFEAIVTKVGDRKISLKTEYMLDAYISYNDKIIYNDKDLTFSYLGKTFKIGDSLNVIVSKVDNERNELYVKINY